MCFMYVFALFLIFKEGLFVEGGPLDCVCLSKDLNVKGDNQDFSIPSGECVRSIDEVTGLHGEVWNYLKYSSQRGWVKHDDNIMRKVICGRQALSQHVCIDVLLDCKQYNETNPDVCNNFPEWSRDNCRKFCGFCGERCLDMRDNCHVYDSNMCTNYTHWARINCQNHCAFCVNPTTTLPPPTTPFSCVDLPTCNFLMAEDICSDPLSAKKFCPVACKIPECAHLA